MPTDSHRAKQYLEQLKDRLSTPHPEALLLPDAEQISTAPRVAGASRIDPSAVERRWEMLKATDAAKDALLDGQTSSEMEAFEHNIENFIGTVKVPVGLAGPLRMRGLHARGDFYVPLATTEAALVASYARGAQLISEAGGCAAAVINEAIGRSPMFAFRDLVDAGRFVVWMTDQVEAIRQEAQSTTRYGKLLDVKLVGEGNHVYVLMEYTTGSAAGQNMVTIATEAACEWILANSPVAPEYWFIEGNMSGDKKASAQSFQSVRGRKVTAEVMIPAELVRHRLHCEVRAMVNYYHASVVGGMMSGTMGIQGHYANGLAALFIACGQDAACVAESAVGITRMEERPDGALYVAVTLPNLVVGTVGGGTGLPAQRACLELMGLAGEGHAPALAEVCAGLVMAGEISISGAMAAGQFMRAHRKRARGKK